MAASVKVFKTLRTLNKEKPSKHANKRKLPKLMLIHDAADWHGNSTKYGVALFYKNINADPENWPIIKGQTLGDFSEDGTRKLLLRSIDKHRPDLIVVADIPINLTNPEGTIETLRVLSEKSFVVFLDHHPGNNRFQSQLRELEASGSFKWIQTSGLSMSLFLAFLLNGLVHLPDEIDIREVVESVVTELEIRNLLIKEGAVPTEDNIESLNGLLEEMQENKQFTSVLLSLIVFMSGNYTDFDPSVYCSVQKLPKQIAEAIESIGKASIVASAVAGDPAHPLFVDKVMSITSLANLERVARQLKQVFEPLYKKVVIKEEEIEKVNSIAVPRNRKSRVKLIEYYDGDAQQLFSTSINKLMSEYIRRGYADVVAIANYFFDDRSGNVYRPTILLVSSPCQGINLLDIARRINDELGIEGSRIVGHPSFTLWFLPYQGKTIDEVKEKLPPNRFKEIVAKVYEELNKELS